MTKSQISSSINIPQILKLFLEGDITLSELQYYLKNLIQIDFSCAPGVRRISNILVDSNIKIPVKKEHLVNMLKKFRSNEISDLDLSNWASFVYMAPFFVPEGNSEEEQWEAGEGPVWLILQQLAFPEIFDGMDYAIAGKYIEQLET